MKAYRVAVIVEDERFKIDGRSRPVQEMALSSFISALIMLYFLLSGGGSMLESERDFYNEHASEWAHKYPNKVILVKENSLIGVYDRQEDALTAGVSKYGLGAFLVRPVGQLAQSVSVPALTLGLLNANP